MPVVQRSALAPYSAAQMYALVDDVRSYPAFLPWCRSAREWARNDDEVRATIEFSRGALCKAFTTHNRLQRDKMIEMRLIEGPFRHLEGYWRFESLAGQGCKVSLDLEYEFSSVLIRVVVGPVFDHIANSLVDAFSRRAKEMYGEIYGQR